MDAPKYSAVPLIYVCEGFQMVLRIKQRQNRIMFLNERLTDLYLSLPRGPLAEACSLSGVAYTHALKMINYWAALGLIMKNKSGQQYNFFYTAKGNRLANDLLKLKTLLKRNKVQWSYEGVGFE